MSTHVRMLGWNLQVRWWRGEWLWAWRRVHAARSPPPCFSAWIHHVTLGCRNEQPHGWVWANPKQCTALQESRDTQLEMVNASDGDLRYNKKKRKKRWRGGEKVEGSTGASGRRHGNICCLLSTKNLLFKVKSITFSLPNTYFFLRRRGRSESPDRRKASAGGKVNRHSLLYSGHFIHLVGLIKRQVEFLDI